MPNTSSGGGGSSNKAQAQAELQAAQARVWHLEGQLHHAKSVRDEVAAANWDRVLSTLTPARLNNEEPADKLCTLMRLSLSQTWAQLTADRDALHQAEDSGRVPAGATEAKSGREEVSAVDDAVAEMLAGMRERGLRDTAFKEVYGLIGAVGALLAWRSKLMQHVQGLAEEEEGGDS